MRLTAWIWLLALPLAAACDGSADTNPALKESALNRRAGCPGLPRELREGAVQAAQRGVSDRSFTTSATLSADKVSYRVFVQLIGDKASSRTGRMALPSPFAAPTAPDVWVFLQRADGPGTTTGPLLVAESGTVSVVSGAKGIEELVLEDLSFKAGPDGKTPGDLTLPSQGVGTWRPLIAAAAPACATRVAAASIDLRSF